MSPQQVFHFPAWHLLPSPAQTPTPVRKVQQLCYIFLEEITKWIDKESPVDIIYLDFKKAFDKVSHQRLLVILKAHGIGDSIIDWIEKWLTERRQRVVIDGEVSNWKSVLSGVPQGSVL